MSDERDARRRALLEAARDTRSGAAEIARRAADALAALPRDDVPEAVATLLRAHPSMAPLWQLGSAVLSEADHVPAAARFARDVAREPAAVAALAASLLPPVVVTLSFSGTLIEAVATARVRALCARSEPGGEGARTAGRLLHLGVDAHVVTDEEALRAAERGTAVVVGADAVGPGGVVNKVGTAALADAARRGGAVRFALAGRSKLVAVDLPATGPFERTPLDAFTAIVTDGGVLSAAETVNAAAADALHPALLALLPR